MGNAGARLTMCLRGGHARGLNFSCTRLLGARSLLRFSLRAVHWLVKQVLNTKNAFISITDTGKTFMRWKIIILYLTYLYLVERNTSPKIGAIFKPDPNRITWPCGKGSLEGSLNPPPTPLPHSLHHPCTPCWCKQRFLYYSTVSVGFAETRVQDRMNASRSASMRHSGPGLGLNLEPVLWSS